MTSFTTRRQVLKGMGLSAFAIGVAPGCAQQFTETAALEGGSSDRPSEGGVGGTGIVGVVHDVGSLLVNGLRVETPEAVANNILDGIEAGHEEVFPDPMAVDFGNGFLASPKETERGVRAMLTQ